ncbi:MAG: winged helix-turn-helix domain-containing protein [Candidatus Aminicenantes bacterium]|jgi:hypothetical protein
MKEKIGATAGKIWKILQKKDQVAISHFPRLMNEKAVLVNQALGWLAREDKIEYKTEKNKTLVSLVESERIKQKKSA